MPPPGGENIDDMYIRLDIITQCDGQTDGETDGIVKTISRSVCYVR